MLSNQISCRFPLGIILIQVKETVNFKEFFVGLIDKHEVFQKKNSPRSRNRFCDEMIKFKKNNCELYTS